MSEFKVGDRIIIKSYEHQRSHGYPTHGEIIRSHYKHDGTYQIIWDIPEGYVSWDEVNGRTTWVHCDSIILDKQYLRDIKINQILNES